MRTPYFLFILSLLLLGGCDKESRELGFTHEDFADKAFVIDTVAHPNNQNDVSENIVYFHADGALETISGYSVTWSRDYRWGIDDALLTHRPTEEYINTASPAGYYTHTYKHGGYDAHGCMIVDSSTKDIRLYFCER